MKCLSIKQPWASLIIKGIKDIENRNWKSGHRGQVLIHASKQQDIEGETWLCSMPAYRNEMNRFYEFYPNSPYGWPSGIIGQVEMVDCVNEHISKWFFGRYGFMFLNPIEFSRHIPYPGKLGIFDVPDSLITERI